jgi:hypothetical protein
MDSPNGSHQDNYKAHLIKIEGSLEDLRDDLAHAVKDLTRAVQGLTQQISMWDRAVPIKLVIIMFGVVVATVGSIEAIKAFIKIAIG